MRGDLPVGRLQRCLAILEVSIDLAKRLKDHEDILRLQLDINACLVDETRRANTTVWLGMMLAEARRQRNVIRSRPIIQDWQTLIRALLTFSLDDSIERVYRERLQILVEIALSQPQRFLRQALMVGASGFTNIEALFRWIQILELELHPEIYFFPDQPPLSTNQ